MVLTSAHVNRKGRLAGGFNCSCEVPRAREDFKVVLKLPGGQELGPQLGPKTRLLRTRPLQNDGTQTLKPDKNQTETNTETKEITQKQQKRIKYWVPEGSLAGVLGVRF